MKTHTQTATVREMRTLANTCKTHAADAADSRNTCQKHAADAAESWKNSHTLAATAHSAANRACKDAIDAENAALRACNALRATIITLLIANAINIALIFIIFFS